MPWNELIQGLGRCGDGGVKTEGTVRGLQIIINGFGNADNRHTHFSETMRYFQTPVPADSDMTAKAHAFECGHHLVRDIHQLFLVGKILHGHGKGISLIRCAEDRAAGGGDAFNIRGHQADHLIPVQKSPVAVPTAVDLPAEFGCGLHYRKNHRVQAGRISPACGNHYFTHYIHLVTQITLF